MNIIFFSHPKFLRYQSMLRYTNMLSEGMKRRGHNVEVWSPDAFFHQLKLPLSFKKWLGYIDIYILFPCIAWIRIKRCPQETLFVLTDQALGPWMWLIRRKNHVVHCHDFLALKSALGEIPENKTGWSGKIYQSIIRKGFSKAKNFIPVSYNTKKDLNRFHLGSIVSSKVVYNGLDRSFYRKYLLAAKKELSQSVNCDIKNGFILHVGGNQWYKNRLGVIEIYEQWRSSYFSALPLLLVGETPDTSLLNKYSASPYKHDIYFLTSVTDEQLKVAYSLATLLLFPSYAEGFGWPIAEAMALGCPVITTNEAPMTEVAEKAACFINRRPNDNTLAEKWAKDSAVILNQLVNMDTKTRDVMITEGIKNSQKFDTEISLDEIELIYKKTVPAKIAGKRMTGRVPEHIV